MPVKKTKCGYKYGTKGKCYPTKEQAEKQGRGNQSITEQEEKQIEYFTKSKVFINMKL